MIPRVFKSSSPCALNFQLFSSRLIQLIKVRFDQLNLLTMLKSLSLFMWSKGPWLLDRASPLFMLYWTLDLKSCTRLQGSKIKVQRSRFKTLFYSNKYKTNLTTVQASGVRRLGWTEFGLTRYLTYSKFIVKTDPNWPVH